MMILGEWKQSIFSKSLICLFFVGLVFNSGFAQEMSKKELKEKEQAERSEETLALIESKTFTFEARTAIASGGRTVNLTSNQNFIKFSPDMVESEMPFFGQATGAGHYGADDAGLNFKGRPEKYSVEKKKRNYRIKMEVKDSKDSYHVNLSVEMEGSSTVTLTSNRKSVMTYNGRISKN